MNEYYNGLIIRIFRIPSYFQDVQNHQMLKKKSVKKLKFSGQHPPKSMYGECPVADPEPFLFISKLTISISPYLYQPFSISVSAFLYICISLSLYLYQLFSISVSAFLHICISLSLYLYQHFSISVSASLYISVLAFLYIYVSAFLYISVSAFLYICIRLPLYPY